MATMTLAIVGASIGAAVFGMVWAGLPATFKPKGEVISLLPRLCLILSLLVLNFFLVDVLKPAGSMDPASANFPASTPPYLSRYCKYNWL